MYVVTNHTKHPLIPTVPVEKQVKEKRYVERRDAEGKSVAVTELHTRTRVSAKSLYIPESLPGKDPGALAISEDDYELLKDDPIFRRWSTPRHRGGEGLCTVSIDPAYARELGEQMRKQRGETKKFKPAKPTVIAMDDEDEDFEEEEAPAPAPKSRRTKKKTEDAEGDDASSST